MDMEEKKTCDHCYHGISKISQVLEKGHSKKATLYKMNHSITGSGN